ncbi:hypothetical protein B0H66DRAFT_307203 [Apodospora peruviana]|uniref:Uncharacterized protein n=1 Tax=Apodospora peruviana TaxID=516989 RepID=A0AAE0M302_9PEZI|nr:hypothetical protein B0H66DRAFT_307203 [Apodospora peruviana]
MVFFPSKLVALSALATLSLASPIITGSSPGEIVERGQDWVIMFLDPDCLPKHERLLGHARPHLLGDRRPRAPGLWFHRGQRFGRARLLHHVAISERGFPVSSRSGDLPVLDRPALGRFRGQVRLSGVRSVIFFGLLFLLFLLSFVSRGFDSLWLARRVEGQEWCR